MKKIILLAFVFLLFSTVVVVRFVSPVVAEGTIYIRSDGSVEGTDNIQRDGNVYTFTDDIFGSIVVERDNIVVDGAGYTLQGSDPAGPSTGIRLWWRKNVTIKNMIISTFFWGIDLHGFSSSNNSVYGNDITNCEYGITIRSFSNGNIISGNNIANNNIGILIDLTANNNILRNNSMDNNKYNFNVDAGCVNDVDTSNTVDGKPIYYWVNQQDRTVPSDAGYVALVNCTNITVQNLNLANNQHGILLASTTNSTIAKNKITNSEYGVFLHYSSYNTINENNIKNIRLSGIELGEHSNNNSICGNSIEASNREGIYLFGASNNSIIGNNITNNYFGIRLSGSSNNMFRNNDVSNNEYNFGVYGALLPDFIQDIDDSNTVNGKPVYYWVNRRDMAVPFDAGWIALINCTRITVKNLDLANNGQGVLLAYTTDSTITKNNITKNIHGIYLSGSSNNTINENNITENTGSGIYLYYSSNNIIHHNNFINNTKQVSDVYVLFFGSPSVNIWDDDYPSGGNYWSDYTGEDANGDGIGDTPYVIYEKNQDNYPLMNRWVPSTQQSELFPTWIIATIVIVVVVGVAFLVYFARVKKTTGKVEK